MTMFDAILVGARCAGSPTAMLLARAGHRVLLLDRTTFPSDTLSTHVIHQPGAAASPAGACWSPCVPPAARRWIAHCTRSPIFVSKAAPGAWRGSVPDTPPAATSWTPCW